MFLGKNMSETSKEDLNIIDMILDKLAEEIGDLSRFSCSVSESYEDVVEYTTTSPVSSKTAKSRSREFTIEFTVSDSAAVRIDFLPTFGVMTTSLLNPSDYNWSETHDVEVGWYSDNKDIKIKFMKMYRKIDNYQKIEIPRRNRERFINKAAEVFPDILDHMILGERDD